MVLVKRERLKAKFGRGAYNASCESISDLMLR